MSKRRVVVTGMGMVTPLGNTLETTWEGLVAGRSGIGLIEHYDVSSYSTKFAGLIKGLDLEPYINKKTARKMDAFIQYGIVAGLQAIENAGLEANESNAHRIGVAMGAGMGGIQTIEANHGVLEASGPRKVSPFLIPGSIINMISGHLSLMKGFRGPNFSIATACTSATHSIGYSARTIAYGDADVMVTGGGESGSSPLGMAGFCAARALSKRNDSPEEASRPWDRDRDGFVLSDGAGSLVLEEYEHAKARGATIYGELVGFGTSSDAHHITSPPADGAGAALSMKNALNDAKIAPSDVDYVNAHGTSTPAGDIAETAAIKTIFGSTASDLMVSSTKSMTGHLLGAAGAIESIISLLAINNNIAPPTINLENPDDGCDLDYVAGVARERTINVAVSNSFGFGGTNGTLVFKQFSG
ncbi:beta-ketoacyl-[acyl-carrier-protein] synthase II [Gammaproteobacteria bacterium 45_16_T64]|nr:beta-ketoacyl-[acyl-carrier-protein] synthase II [Gammaproteobacteria bacterium 45_16_T64]